MAIATNKVTERRQLHFDNLEAIREDVERLAQGPVRALGNWTPAQILRHLSVVMDGSIDGYAFRFPLPMRVIARLLKGWVLSRPMPPGFQLKSKAAEALVPPPVEWAEALEGFRRSIHRQLTEDHRMPSPVFGPMSRDDWNRLHCRHAELHLSFLVPSE
jgi:hypothetical protein